MEKPGYGETGWPVGNETATKLRADYLNLPTSVSLSRLLDNVMAGTEKVTDTR